MKLTQSPFPEMTPSLLLTRTELVILANAATICERARGLTTTDTDDESVWADAQLALLEAIDEAKNTLSQQRRKAATTEATK